MISSPPRHTAGAWEHASVQIALRGGVAEEDVKLAMRTLLLCKSRLVGCTLVFNHPPRDLIKIGYHPEGAARYSARSPKVTKLTDADATDLACTSTKPHKHNWIVLAWSVSWLATGSVSTMKLTAAQPP